MRILSRYIMSTFLVSFISAVFVLTFVMSIGAVFKLSDLVVRGVDWRLLVTVFALSMPQVLSYCIPIGALASCLLVFGRLSADSEIVAMRACGISLYRIAAPVWACALALSILGFVLLNWVVPITHLKTRIIIARLKSTSIEDVIEEGRFIQATPELSIYVGKRTADGFDNVRAYDTQEGFRREITAHHARIVRDPDGGKSMLELSDVRIDPFQKGQLGAATCAVWSIPMDIGKKNVYNPKTTNLTCPQLIEQIKHPHKARPDLKGDDLASEVSQWRVELHTRMALSLSCLMFLVLGVPLGIRSHRRETSAGIALSLGVVLCFHIFMILADSVSKRPLLIPHLIVWIPIVAGMVAGMFLMRRAA